MVPNGESVTEKAIRVRDLIEILKELHPDALCRPNAVGNIALFEDWPLTWDNYFGWVDLLSDTLEMVDNGKAGGE